MSGGDQAVGIKESTDFGDIVTGLEVVHTHLTVEDVATVHEGIEVIQGLGVGADGGIVGAVHRAPRIVIIGDLEVLIWFVLATILFRNMHHS